MDISSRRKKARPVFGGSRDRLASSARQYQREKGKALNGEAGGGNNMGMVESFSSGRTREPLPSVHRLFACFMFRLLALTAHRPQTLTMFLSNIGAPMQFDYYPGVKIPGAIASWSLETYRHETSQKRNMKTDMTGKRDSVFTLSLATFAGTEFVNVPPRAVRPS